MIIIKRIYHFYAGHRNEKLKGSKCEKFHGHRYGIEVSLQFKENGSDGVTLPFEDIDSVMDPIIKEYDHSMLINKNDPFYKELIDPLAIHSDDFSAQDRWNELMVGAFKFVVFDDVTSVENLAERLYNQTKQTPLWPFVLSISVQETDSAIAVYTPKS